MPAADHSHQAAAVDLLREALLEACNPLRIRISGQCMEPLILDSDEISVLPTGNKATDNKATACKPETLRLGDLVLAHTASHELVCHRIIAFGSDGFLLAGDRTLRFDLHAPESILARVVAVHRRELTLGIPRPGPWTRLQVALHLQVKKRYPHPWIRLWEWPRLLLIHGRALGWHRAESPVSR